jgi:hypothetical protein
VGVGDEPAFTVGGDVAGASDPGVAGDGVDGEVAEAGCPGGLCVGDVFTKFVYAAGDPVGSPLEPISELAACRVGVVRIVLRWAGYPAR